MYSGETAFVVDDVVVAREGDPAPYPSQQWANVYPLTSAIDNDGHWIVAGHMGPGPGQHPFIAYDGVGAIRSSDTVDGVTLTGGWQGVALNNLGHAAVNWFSDGDYYMFHTCDASQMLQTARLVVAEGDELDFDGDGIGDATVGNIFTLSSVNLTDSGETYLRTILDDDDSSSLVLSSTATEGRAPAVVGRLCAGSSSTRAPAVLRRAAPCNTHACRFTG